MLNGSTVKVGNYNNQIFLDGDYFCVEKFEYTDSNGVDIFSVYNSYANIEDALKFASIVNENKIHYLEYK